MKCRVTAMFNERGELTDQSDCKPVVSVARTVRVKRHNDRCDRREADGCPLQLVAVVEGRGIRPERGWGGWDEYSRYRGRKGLSTALDAARAYADGYRAGRAAEGVRWGSRGTADMVRMAQGAGLPVWLVRERCSGVEGL